MAIKTTVVAEDKLVEVGVDVLTAETMVSAETPPQGRLARLQSIGPKIGSGEFQRLAHFPTSSTVLKDLHPTLRNDFSLTFLFNDLLLSPTLLL
jgi:hypothetical protein